MFLVIVCAFDALGAVPSGDAAGGSPAKASVNSDLRWRASFAVQLYSALEMPTFRSLEPWLFRTSLRSLQPLVTRFWREDCLDLMEKVLRVVDAQSASTGRVVAALAGWRTHSLDADISDAQLQQTVDTFRHRLKAAPQQQQAYRQQRRQQRQLTAVETHAPAGHASVVDNKQSGMDRSSSGVACGTSTAASIEDDEQHPPGAPNPPVPDLFFLSSSSYSTAFQTGKSIVAPPQHWTSGAAATAAAGALEDAADDPTSERGDAPSSPSSALSSPALQSSEHDAAALVALATADGSKTVDSRGSYTTHFPSPSPRSTSTRWSPPVVPTKQQAVPSHHDTLKGRGVAAASARTDLPTCVKKKKENKKRKRSSKQHSMRASSTAEPCSIRAASTVADAQLEEEEEEWTAEEETSQMGSDGESAVDDDGDDDEDNVGDEGDTLDEHWTTSCADSFASLLERYPLLLKLAPRCNGPTAEMQLRGGPAAAAGAVADETALSCAMIVYGLPAPSPVSNAAMRSELAAALVEPKVRKSVTLKLQTSKDGCVETRVREQQEQ